MLNKVIKCIPKRIEYSITTGHFLPLQPPRRSVVKRAKGKRQSTSHPLQCYSLLSSPYKEEILCAETLKNLICHIYASLHSLLMRIGLALSSHYLWITSAIISSTLNNSSPLFFFSFLFQLLPSFIFPRIWIQLTAARQCSILFKPYLRFLSYLSICKCEFTFQ